MGGVGSTVVHTWVRTASGQFLVRNSTSFVTPALFVHPCKAATGKQKAFKVRKLVIIASFDHVR